MSRLDVVIFGATGFTGKHAVLRMARLSKKHPDVTWGVAGRSQSKLEDLMLDVAKKTGADLSDVRVIIADVSDAASLEAMCGETRVVANCCGPYRRLGEPVLRAALRARAHHVDVTGEPQFIETMQLKYDREAREAGVYVISACGYDSIPNDLGTVFLQQQFGGTVNSVESYMSTTLPAQYRREAMRQGSVHYGTWESLVYGLANHHELKPLRMKLYPEKMPTFEPKLQKRSIIHKRDNAWCLPFPGADNSIVYRTQRTLYETSGERPAQFRAYFKFGSWLTAVMLMLAAGVFYLFTKVAFLRQLLLDYPRFFTLGMISHEGPTEAVMENARYKVELYGEGWAEGTDVKQKPNKRVAVKVSGMNPGYGATVSALLYSAITILKENDKIPGNGGVLTTGYAFRNTNIIKHLSEDNENNMKFEVVDSSAI